MSATPEQRLEILDKQIKLECVKRDRDRLKHATKLGLVLETQGIHLGQMDAIRESVALSSDLNQARSDAPQVEVHVGDPLIAELISLTGGWEVFIKAVDAAIAQAKTIEGVITIRVNGGRSTELEPTKGGTVAADIATPEPDKVTFVRMESTPTGEEKADPEQSVTNGCLDPELSSALQCFSKTLGVPALLPLGTADELRLDGEAALRYRQIPCTSGSNGLKRDMRIKEGEIFEAFLPLHKYKWPANTSHPIHLTQGEAAQDMEEPIQESAAPPTESASESVVMLIAPTIDQVEADEYPIRRYIREELEPALALAKAEGRGHDAWQALKALKVAQDIEITHWLIVSNPDHANLDDWLDVDDFCAERCIDPALPPRPLEAEDGPGHWDPDEPWMVNDEDDEEGLYGEPRFTGFQVALFRNQNRHIQECNGAWTDAQVEEAVEAATSGDESPSEVTLLKAADSTVTTPLVEALVVTQFPAPGLESEVRESEEILNPETYLRFTRTLAGCLSLEIAAAAIS